VEVSAGEGTSTGGAAWENDGRRCLPKNAKNSAGACEGVSVVGNSNRSSRGFEVE
jgi:hypothetical protein